MGKAEWALGAILLSAIIAALAASHVGGAPDNWLFHYQALIAGLLALGIAMVAALLLHRQTLQAAALERERQEGQREAARSWLSLHLSSIIRYASGTGEGVWSLMGQCHNNILPGGVQMPALPILPMDAVIAVKEFVEFSNKEEAKFLALMFATMQVLETRVGGLAAAPAGRHYGELENYLEDAAELYARAETLLSYARHTTPTFPVGVTWERFSAALFFMTHFHDPTEGIARHIANGSQGNPLSLMPNRFERD